VNYPLLGNPAPSPVVAGLIWSGLSLGLLVLGALFALEAFTYFTRQPPITFYVRNWSGSHVFLAATAAVILVVASAMAVTHFVLDAG
jgi:zinc transporter ZupT